MESFEVSKGTANYSLSLSDCSSLQTPINGFISGWVSIKILSRIVMGAFGDLSELMQTAQLTNQPNIAPYLKLNFYTLINETDHVKDFIEFRESKSFEKQFKKIYYVYICIYVHMYFVK